MTCWRCGRLGKHAAWCSMPGGCFHCGWSPCRWWCEGELGVGGQTRVHTLNEGMPPYATPAYQRERYRRIAAGTWVWSAA